jgi:prepilin-type N-terminal cleavage/methylation domain-containing protein
MCVRTGWLVREARCNMRKRAFSLVELLVVIAIIALLLALLLPGMRLVRERGRAVVCKSNLKQFITSAHIYTCDNEDRYPMAYIQRATSSGGTPAYDCWDFLEPPPDVTPTTTLPGFLWQGDSVVKIQQCPSYRGSANWRSDPYTGYNYNASFIGGTATSIDGSIVPMTVVLSTRASDIKCNSRTTVFGDGEYISGANKFMRSPLRGLLDKSFTARSAGSQGFRHMGSTNFAVADGSVQSSCQPVEEVGRQICSKGTGFLSSDNSAYELK